jgi:hypothetical protein
VHCYPGSNSRLDKRCFTALLPKTASATTIIFKGINPPGRIKRLKLYSADDDYTCGAVSGEETRHTRWPEEIVTIFTECTSCATYRSPTAAGYVSSCLLYPQGIGANKFQT